MNHATVAHIVRDAVSIPCDELELIIGTIWLNRAFDNCTIVYDSDVPGNVVCGPSYMERQI